MDIGDKDPANLLVKALLTIAFSGVTTAALSKEKWTTAFKTFIAGLCAGAVAYLILTTAKVNSTWVLVCCAVISAFVSSLWPLAGEAAKKYFKKKSDDILPRS